MGDDWAPVANAPGADYSVELAGPLALLDDLIANSRAENTKLAYRRDWERFEGWCRQRRIEPMPAEPRLLAAYISDASSMTSADGRPKYSPATMTRWVSGINKVHQLAGHLPPGKHVYVEAALAGIRRTRAMPPRRVDPLLLDDLRIVLGAIDLRSWPAGVAGRRDACMLMVGFTGAFRRSEVAALRDDDVSAHRTDGLHVMLRRAKNDQEAAGHKRALPYGSDPLTCPPCAVRRWREVVHAIGTGGRPAAMRLMLTRPGADTHVCRDADAPPVRSGEPLLLAVDKAGSLSGRFLSGHAVRSVVKRRAAAVGMDPTDLAGHSLRAGFVTQAFREGASATEIARQTGQTEATVMIYRREHAPLIGNAVGMLRL